MLFVETSATLSAPKADAVDPTAHGRNAQLASAYLEGVNADGLVRRARQNAPDRLRKGRVAKYDVFEYCKAHLDENMIHAIGHVFKDIRAGERARRVNMI
jgi:hypothetical protein